MKSLDRYDSLFTFYCELYTFDWQRLKAQGMAESNLQPSARSTAGAVGLMQFMPATFEEYANKLHLRIGNPYNPEHSIQCAAAYMHDLMQHYGGDWDKALAAYNFGMGKVDRGVNYPQETTAYIARCHSFFNGLSAVLATS